jgi:hypothetical protein
MTAIVLFPALLAGMVVITHDFRRTLVFVGIPCLLLLPSYYILEIKGIPSPTFHTYLFLVLGIALLLGRDRKLIDFHWADLIVLLFVLLVAVSELTTKGVPDARNLLATNVMLLVIPYALGRAIANANGLVVGTLAVLVVVGALIGLVAPYEARMGRNPFDWLRDRWPGSVPWDGATYRMGLRRVAGPFAHPICQGFFFSLVLPPLLWLRAEKLLGRSRRANLILLGCVLGLLFAMSRGPILGALLAVGVTKLGWLRERVAATGLALLLSCVLGVFAFDTVRTYLTVSRGEARTQEQETAAYRTEMLDNYLEVVERRPIWGYGKDGFPLLKGQKSIDNQYLLLALAHGLPASIAFLFMLLAPIGLLGRVLARLPFDHRLGRLGWALLGALAGAVFTQITVFSGTQTAQVLAILQGLAVGMSIRLGRETSHQQIPSSTPAARKV